ncbi:MAG: pirin family protein [Sphaerochaetaceae bacterium]|jgi:redox-sensitive bicupin YhaK (pirin superfamily)|nr:pirin family protein [Sphaerochaetaceae bacterium]MDD3367089.1 pirin family protein [Sphaerochaetaceae bacterium]MDY0371317.1 pirin family protein [Sphaerochaetaceae bacterium]
MGNRVIGRLVDGNVQYDGAGVKLRRVFGRPDTQDFDPFLLLDAFDSRDPKEYLKGFPWHPHRGIETVTYLIHGNIEHRDTLGNQGSILDGSCQWMTAGRGILHQEMPQSVDRLLGVQLWINLPQKMKMTVPAYRDISATMVAEVMEEFSAVRIIAGRYREKVGPVEGNYVKARLLDVEVKPNAKWHTTVDTKNTVVCYLFQGSGQFDDTDTLVASAQAVLLQNGDHVTVKAGAEGVRFLFAEGMPLQEPIAWGGPIVMNTREELSQAFKEIDEGTFIKE